MTPLLTAYRQGQRVEAWNAACDILLTDLSDAEREATWQMAYDAIDGFLASMKQARDQLIKLGYEFDTPDEAIRVWDNPGSHVLPQKSLEIVQQLPVVVQAWFFKVRRIHFNQKWSQIHDKQSPFRGLGLFCLGLHFDTDDLLDDDGKLSGALAGSEEQAAALGVFWLPDSPLFIPLPCERLDGGFIDANQNSYRFIDLMRREARYGGLSRYPQSTQLELPIQIDPNILTGSFPQAIDF